MRAGEVDNLVEANPSMSMVDLSLASRSNAGVVLAGGALIHVSKVEVVTDVVVQ